jgi:uncharacterized membrane protein YgcG
MFSSSDLLRGGLALGSDLCFLNLNLFRIVRSEFFYQVNARPAFYRFTYAMIWLMTNKPYLHGVQKIRPSAPHTGNPPPDNFQGGGGRSGGAGASGSF